MKLQWYLHVFVALSIKTLLYLSLIRLFLKKFEAPDVLLNHTTLRDTKIKICPDEPITPPPYFLKSVVDSCILFTIQ